MDNRVLSIIAIVISLFSLYISHHDSLTNHQDAQAALAVSDQANEIAQAARFDAQQANDISEKSLKLSVSEANSHQPRIELKSCGYGMSQAHFDSAVEIGLTRSDDTWANDTTPQYSIPEGGDMLSCVLRNSGDREATDLAIDFPYVYVPWHGVPVKSSDQLFILRHAHVSIAALQPGEELLLEVYNADASFASDLSMGDATLQYQFGTMTTPALEQLYRTSRALARLCPIHLSCTKKLLAQL